MKNALFLSLALLLSLPLACSNHTVSLGSAPVVGTVGPAPVTFGRLPTSAPPPPRATMLTRSYDNARTGANLHETILNTSNVTSTSFGLVFSRAVQGQIYAQPLYVSRLPIADGIHDVVFVATEHDMVYAFDANDPEASEALWQRRLADPVPSADLVDAFYCADLSPEVGITATPVIDLASSTMYVDAKSKDAEGYHHRLHALDLATGAERAGSPVEITASVEGNGYSNVSGVVTFDARKQNGRAGLLLSNGVVYLAFAGHCDSPPYYGWVLAYDARTLAQVGVFNDAPDTGNGGIWMGGQGLAADAEGDVYFVSGNAAFDDTAPRPSFGDSFGKLRLYPSGLTIVDWFAPFNADELDSKDLDLGSSGALLVPDTHLIIGAGKQGKMYVLDRRAMGHHGTTDDSQIVQSFQATPVAEAAKHGVYGSPVFWHGPLGPTVYLWGQSDDLRAFSLRGDQFDPEPSSQSTITPKPAAPGGILTLSANGATQGTGIVWGTHAVTDSGSKAGQGVMRAFDAEDLSRELWNSEDNATRDAIGVFGRFTPPTVVNGHVYVATFSNKLNVYGLVSDPAQE